MILVIGGKRDMRENALPILESYGVDVVLSDIAATRTKDHIS
ncbi:MAG: hypothetical protein R2753_11900 [Chitinophagales bacterium]